MIGGATLEVSFCHHSPEAAVPSRLMGSSHGWQQRSNGRVRTMEPGGSKVPTRSGNAVAIGATRAWHAHQCHSLRRCKVLVGALARPVVPLLAANAANQQRSVAVCEAGEWVRQLFHLALRLCARCSEQTRRHKESSGIYFARALSACRHPHSLHSWCHLPENRKAIVLGQKTRQRRFAHSIPRSKKISSTDCAVTPVSESPGLSFSLAPNLRHCLRSSTDAET